MSLIGTLMRPVYHQYLWMAICLHFGAMTMLTQQQQQPQLQSQQPQTNQLNANQLAPDNNNSNNNLTLAQILAQMYTQQQQQAAAIGIPGASPNSNQFVIKLIQNDSKHNQAYVSIVPVNYTNLHEPRIELRYQSKYPFVSIDERTPNNTVVAAVVVNDEDSGPNGETTLSIEHGNDLSHFKLISTSFTNTIQVNGAPLSKARVPEYNLTIVARDHGTPPKSSSVNLVIKLNTSSGSAPSASNPPVPPGPLEASSNLKPPVTDLMYVGSMLVVIFFVFIFVIILGCVLVQRPKSKKSCHPHPQPPPRAPSSAANSRIHPNDHCPFVSLSNM